MESKGVPEGHFSVFSETLVLNNSPTFLLEFQGFRRSERLKKRYHNAIRKKVLLKTYFWLKSDQQKLILGAFFARNGDLFFIFLCFFRFGAQGCPKGAQTLRKDTKLSQSAPKCFRNGPKKRSEKDNLMVH